MLVNNNDLTCLTIQVGGGGSAALRRVGAQGLTGSNE